MTQTGLPSIPDLVRSHVRIVSSSKFDPRQGPMVGADKPAVAALVSPSATRQ